MTGTDLPVPLRGTGGSIPERLDRILDEAIDCVSAPPLHDTSLAAVCRWLREAQQQLVFRREQLALVRQVEHILRDERATAMRIEEARAAFDRRAEADELKRQGTYWPERERRRTARRPCRFRIDDDEWEALRCMAASERSTLGLYLGAILSREAARLRAGGDVRSQVPDAAGLRPRFIRIAVDDDDWVELSDAARSGRSTITAYVSATVGRDVSTRRRDPA